jgi:hypothetical protein
MHPFVLSVVFTCKFGYSSISSHTCVCQTVKLSKSKAKPVAEKIMAVNRLRSMVPGATSAKFDQQTKDCIVDALTSQGCDEGKIGTLLQEKDFRILVSEVFSLAENCYSLAENNKFKIDKGNSHLVFCFLVCCTNVTSNS